MAPAAAAAPAHYTVDELSARTGVSSRTIRFYQTEDILPPPRRRGRIALYGDEHVERLQLVSMLQSRGLRLTAIRDALRRVRPELVSMHEWLGLDDILRTPWTDDAPRAVTAAELRRVLANHDRITEAGLRRAGLLRDARGGGIELTSPALLSIALRLDSAGIDLDTALAAAGIVRDQLAPAAAQLVAHFADRVGRGFGSAATPKEVARAFDVLRPLSVEAVRIIFGQEIQRALHNLLGGSRRPASPRLRRL
ncbi:MAG TPA: MerR family transcriptional regulator [Candidatus Angelobacter sp.]|jgi:DNA-binding transcriptional MerR regulator|nr:MerR family transcriptional regulator [Candidatus Angelobacter sp.]